MTFTLIVVIVAIVILVNQNNRLAKLETLVSSLSKSLVINSRDQVKPVTPATSTPAPLGANQVIQPVVIQQSVPVSNSSVSVDKKSDEESSGRMLGKLGIVAVLLGVAFFLKYAFENNWIGPSGRVMIGVMFGVAFLVIGQVLRNKYLKYSDLIMGGGSAILYLSFFAAHSFYGLISSGVAGILMLGVTALTLTISIVNATMTLSLVGVIGAFATPFLVSSGVNTMIPFFFYLTIINLGVLGISFFKKWQKLNAITFLGTVINFISWYATFYESTALVPTLFFCLVTFLIFIIANVAQGVTVGQKTDQVDYFLLGGNALFFAIVGYVLLDRNYSSVLGFASVCVAVIYLVVALIVNKRNPSDKALNIFLPGLAVTFLSLAVPLQFSGPAIAVAWLVESVCLYLVASNISNRGFQVMGLIVYAIGLFDLLIWISENYSVRAFIPILNTTFIVLILAVVVAYSIVYMYKRFGSTSIEIQKRGVMFFIIVANILTVSAFSLQIINYYDYQVYNLEVSYEKQRSALNTYNTGDLSVELNNLSSEYYKQIESTKNRSNTIVSIIWTLYAAVLTAIGFAKRISSVRRLGLALFVITAIKVFVNVWSLGQIYRVVSFIVFGIIALAASFAYTKYKDRLKDMV